jgi:hypothetical protein
MYADVTARDSSFAITATLRSPPISTLPTAGIIVVTA